MAVSAGLLDHFVRHLVARWLVALGIAGWAAIEGQRAWAG
jgi:hypothetical protein